MKYRNISPLTFVLISALFLCVACEEQEPVSSKTASQDHKLFLNSDFGPYAGLPIISVDSPQNSYNQLKNVPKYNGDINVLFLNSQLSKWDNAKVLKLLRENSKILPRLLQASQNPYCCPPRTKHWDDLRPHTISWRVISRLMSLNAEYFLRNNQHDDGIAMLRANARLAAGMFCYPADTWDLIVASSVVKMQLEVLYRLYKAGWISKSECAGVANYLPDKSHYGKALPYVMAGKYATALDMVDLIREEKSGVVPIHLFGEDEMAVLKKINRERFVEFLISEMNHITETLDKNGDYSFDSGRYPDIQEPEKLMLSMAFYHYPAILRRLGDNNAKVMAMRKLVKNDSVNPKKQDRIRQIQPEGYSEEQKRVPVTQ